ncbi:MAG: HAMP domain-containing protein [Prevotella sp.]|nr:HAMP domain-containing protein [Prevotella sp.]
MMKIRLPRIIRKTLSIRLSLMMVIAMAILLLASLVVMLHYSRKAVKEEALQKAAQTLEGTVQRIDNILLSVEQASGNIYFNILPHLDDAEKRKRYMKQLIASNPYIVDCIIAFKTDSAYAKQPWFVNSMAAGMPGWQDPSASKIAKHPIITFCLPLPGADGQPIGVMAVDASLSLLSQIVLEAKPSANSYSTLLAGDGSFIVYPDSTKLYHQTVFTNNENADPSAQAAAKAMLSGETGYKRFTKNGADYYVFYKPFERAAVTGRSMQKLGWSAGIIYPEDDIFGDYNKLLYYVLIIAFVGLLLLFILCRALTHHQLKPLLLLTRSAQHIAKGHYDEKIPDTNRQDEIGRLQENFQQMQQSLSAKMGEMESLKATMEERSESLQAAYTRIKRADRMKTSFLHNMTIKMVGPANAISMDVNLLCNYSQEIGPQKADSLANDIQKNGEDIAELLSNLINMSDKDMGKEDDHD